MSILPSGLHLGPIALDDSGLIGFLLAFVVFLYMVKREYNKRGGDGEKLTDALLWMGVVWVLTPRVLSFVYAPSESFAHPIVTLVGGEVPYGEWLGAVFALLYGSWMLKRHKFAWRDALEAMATSSVLGFAVYSLFYAEAGAPTGLPWAVTYAGVGFHPFNLYQAAAAFAIFALRRSGALSVALLGGALLLLSLLQVHPYTEFGLARVQWYWLLLALGGLAAMAGKKAEKTA